MTGLEHKRLAKYIATELLQSYLDSGNPVAEEWPGVNSTALHNAIAALRKQLDSACYDRARWQALHHTTAEQVEG